MAGRSLHGPVAPVVLVVGIILGLAGLRSLGLITLLPANGSTDQGPGEVLASRPIDLERARAAPVLSRSRPTRIEIPAIKVDAPVTSLGLDKDGGVQVPPLDEPALTGWYGSGPAPGQRGGAVILGHVDTRRDGPAVFYRLARLRPGDSIEVRRRDGRTARFQVDSVERFPRERFPTSRVYGPLDYPGLRLVTCGGKFDYQRHEYVDNVMVFASGRK
jgi:Sortase domain